MKNKSKIGIFIAIVIMLVQIIESGDSYFEKALALYKKGPEFAWEVIELLKKEIETNPKNLDAHGLLGITYFGTGNFQQALPCLNRVIDEKFLAPIDDGSHSVPAKLIIYKIRSLTNLDRFEEARREESKYWAFISDKEYSSEYKELVDEMNLREKVFFSLYSEKLIQDSEKRRLENYYYIPVRALERKLAEKDGDLKNFTLNMPDSKNSAFVLIISEDNRNQSGYCVYFVKYMPFKLYTFSLKDFNEKKIDSNHMKNNLKLISGSNYKIPKEEEAHWSAFEIETDNSDTLLAFKKNLKHE